MAIRVLGLDHVVLRCVHVETTLRWYVERLGLEPVRVDDWRAGHAPFPSVRVDATTIIDLIPHAAGAHERRASLDDGRIDHLCLVVDARSLERVVGDPTFEIVDGPGPRFGARGVGTAVYVRDPDGLVVELRCYPV